MDANIDEIYAVFGELVAVQAISMRRLQAQGSELQEKLMLAQRQIEKLEGKDVTGDSDNSHHDGREVPVAEGGGQADDGRASLAPVPGNTGDER